MIISVAEEIMTLPTATAIMEADMGALRYEVKVPQLAAEIGLKAMDLVRICDLAVNTAYKAVNPATAHEISLDTCWKVFKGLRDNDIQLVNAGKVREIKFVGDVVVFYDSE